MASNLHVFDPELDSKWLDSQDRELEGIMRLGIWQCEIDFSLAFGWGYTTLDTFKNRIRNLGGDFLSCSGFETKYNVFDGSRSLQSLSDRYESSFYEELPLGTMPNARVTGLVTFKPLIDSFEAAALSDPSLTTNVNSSIKYWEAFRKIGTFTMMYPFSNPAKPWRPEGLNESSDTAFLNHIEKSEFSIRWSYYKHTFDWPTKFDNKVNLDQKSVIWSKFYHIGTGYAQYATPENLDKYGTAYRYNLTDNLLFDGGEVVEVSNRLDTRESRQIELDSFSGIETQISLPFGPTLGDWSSETSGVGSNLDVYYYTDGDTIAGWDKEHVVGFNSSDSKFYFYNLKTFSSSQLPDLPGADPSEFYSNLGIYCNSSYVYTFAKRSLYRRGIDDLTGPWEAIELPQDIYHVYSSNFRKVKSGEDLLFLYYTKKLVYPSNTLESCGKTGVFKLPDLQFLEEFTSINTSSAWDTPLFEFVKNSSFPANATLEKPFRVFQVNGKFWFQWTGNYGDFNKLGYLENGMVIEAPLDFPIAPPLILSITENFILLIIGSDLLKYSLPDYTLQVLRSDLNAFDFNYNRPIQVDPDGTAYVGSYSGIVKIAPDGKISEFTGLSISYSTRSLIRTNSGELFAIIQYNSGTYTGEVVKLNPATNTLLKIYHRGVDFYAYQDCIVGDSLDNLYFFESTDWYAGTLWKISPNGSILKSRNFSKVSLQLAITPDDRPAITFYDQSSGSKGYSWINPLDLSGELVYSNEIPSEILESQNGPDPLQYQPSYTFSIYTQYPPISSTIDLPGTLNYYSNYFLEARKIYLISGYFWESSGKSFAIDSNGLASISDTWEREVEIRQIFLGSDGDYYGTPKGSITVDRGLELWPNICAYSESSNFTELKTLGVNARLDFNGTPISPEEYWNTYHIVQLSDLTIIQIPYSGHG